jgi:hypothetical protein
MIQRGARAIIARLCVAWPFAVAVALEIALRIALWIDHDCSTLELVFPFPASWSAGGWFGYIYLGLLRDWLSIGVVLCLVSLVIARNKRQRLLVLFGMLLDVFLIWYTTMVRY